MKKIKFEIWRIKVKIHQIGKETRKREREKEKNALESAHKDKNDSLYLWSFYHVRVKTCIVFKSLVTLFFL